MLTRLRATLRTLFRRGSFETGMDAEMRFHIAAYTEDLVRAGIPRAEAERRARLEFGSLDKAKDECRESYWLHFPDEAGRNLRFGLRLLARDPIFALTAILTLALCIGANTAIFSLVDAVLLRSLPYPQPERLVQIVVHYGGRGSEGYQSGQTGRTWEFVRENVTLVDTVAMSRGAGGVNLVVDGRAGYVRQQRVGAGFFRILGIAPALGREFTTDEDRPNGPAVAVLSDALWRRLFHGDRIAVGRSVLLRGEPYTVVGVMPPGFRTNAPADLWTPLRPSVTGEGGGQNYSIVGRLRDGVEWTQADAHLATVGEELFRERKLRTGVWIRMGLLPMQRGQTDNVREPLLIIWAAVAVILLIGCLNVAGLLLARGATRGREVATRLALGGSRGAVVRQLLAESLVVAMAGGLAGVALGYFLLAGFGKLAADALGLWQPASLDGRVFGISMGVALLTTMLFGLIPAWEATRVDLRASLAEGGTRSVSGGPRHWPRRALIVTQVALGLVLLLGAGLLIRTFAHLNGLHPGFDPNNVIAATLSLQDARYKSAQSVNRLFDESLARIRTIPGVESAAVGLSMPFERALNEVFQVPGASERRLETTNVCYATPGYLETLRIPLLRGRGINAADGPQAAKVLVVNQAFADRYLPDREPLRAFIDMGGPHQVIGVAGNVQQSAGWGNFGPLAPVPTVYAPAAQISDKTFQLVHTWFSPSWIVRTSGTVEGLAPAIQKAVEAVDPALPFSAIRTAEEIRDRSLVSQRFNAVLLGALAGLALLLAAVGIYGLIANSVVERTRELGIRMALGATLGQAVRAAALPGVWLAIAGVVLGCVLGRLAGRVIQSMLFGVRPTDPLTFVAVAAVLVAVAGLASLIPALRVTRLNPADTLRSE